jgi:hypothetical protein
VSTRSNNKKRAYRTSRAHFYWVTREPLSFEWFKGVMNEVAEMDKKVGNAGRNTAINPYFQTTDRPAVY